MMGNKIFFNIAGIFLLCALLGCSSYTDKYRALVQKEMKIREVYNVPSSAYTPLTLLYHTNKEGYNQVCNVQQVTGISRNDFIENHTDRFSSANFGIVRNKDLQAKIKLEAVELQNLGVQAEYADVYQAILSLRNGLLYQSKDVTIETALNNIKNPNGQCIQNLRPIVRSKPDARFYLTSTVYGYDIDYQVKNSAGVNVSATLPEAVLKVIKAELGADFKNATDAQLEGKQLFIGFNGLRQLYTPEDFSHVSQIGYADPFARLGAEKAVSKHRNKESEPGVTLDITPIVQTIR